MENNINTRLISPDIAKAICIILVVIGHYIPANSPEWWVTIRSIIYSFHMPLFMFISGYVYQHQTTIKNIDYKIFIQKKIKRLMIPYFFVSIVIICIKLLTEKGMYLENPIGFSAFYEMFYLPVAGYFLWFIYSLFIIYLIVPFFNNQKRITILLMTTLVLYFLPIHFTNLFNLSSLKSMMIYFVLGSYICTMVKLKNIIKNNTIIIFFITLFSFICFYIVKLNIENISIDIVLKFCLTLSGILLTCASSYFLSKVNFTKKTLLFISVFSYTIYLFHTTFMGFAKAIFAKIHFLSNSNQIQFVIAAFIIIFIGIIAPIILHKIVEKYSKSFSFLMGIKFVGVR